MIRAEYCELPVIYGQLWKRQNILQDLTNFVSQAGRCWQQVGKPLAWYIGYASRSGEVAIYACFEVLSCLCVVNYYSRPLVKLSGILYDVKADSCPQTRLNSTQLNWPVEESWVESRRRHELGLIFIYLSLHRAVIWTIRSLSHQHFTPWERMLFFIFWRLAIWVQL